MHEFIHEFMIIHVPLP